SFDAHHARSRRLLLLDRVGLFGAAFLGGAALALGGGAGAGRLPAAAGVVDLHRVFRRLRVQVGAGGRAVREVLQRVVRDLHQFILRFLQLIVLHVFDFAVAHGTASGVWGTRPDGARPDGICRNPRAGKTPLRAVDERAAAAVAV